MNSFTSEIDPINVNSSLGGVFEFNKSTNITVERSQHCESIEVSLYKLVQQNSFDISEFSDF